MGCLNLVLSWAREICKSCLYTRLQLLFNNSQMCFKHTLESTKTKQKHIPKKNPKTQTKRKNTTTTTTKTHNKTVILINKEEGMPESEKQRWLFTKYFGTSKN